MGDTAKGQLAIMVLLRPKGRGARPGLRVPNEIGEILKQKCHVFYIEKKKSLVQFRKRRERRWKNVPELSVSLQGFGLEKPEFFYANSLHSISQIPLSFENPLVGNPKSIEAVALRKKMKPRIFDTFQPDFSSDEGETPSESFPFKDKPVLCKSATPTASIRPHSWVLPLRQRLFTEENLPKKPKKPLLKTGIPSPGFGLTAASPQFKKKKVAERIEFDKTRITRPNSLHFLPKVSQTKPWFRAVASKAAL